MSLIILFTRFVSRAYSQGMVSIAFLLVIRNRAFFLARHSVTALRSQSLP